MDPEHTFVRVHARISQVLTRLLTPQFRAAIEYLCLFNAVVLLALLAVMHVNYVAQPGCAAEFIREDAIDAQLLRITITDSTRVFEVGRVHKLHEDARKLVWFRGITRGLTNEIPSRNGDEHHHDEPHQTSTTQADVPRFIRYLEIWSGYLSSFCKRAEQNMRSLAQFWRIAAWEPLAASPKGDRRAVAWNKLDSAVIVDQAERQGKLYDPTYLYSIENGFLILTEATKLSHNIRTVNISVSAENSCFGNRWQRFLIDNFVGYDTILMNSLLAAMGKGYLYNFQTKEIYNLNYMKESGVYQSFEDYVVSKFGVLIMSLFVFFTTTMSVSFTLRETQSRMLRFTIQLQHHARHRLPTFHLIFFHVFESIVFVPIMIGILFFLFEFFDDQLLAFMVLTIVWLCELFTMVSVRTGMSAKYFPWFFFLYFMIFHIYFFSYTYGFSYLAFTATSAFMQHLVLFFWNRFEVPAALHVTLRRRTLLSQVHVTSSALLTQVTRIEQRIPARAAAPPERAAHDDGGGGGGGGVGGDGGEDTARQGQGLEGSGTEDSTQAAPQVSITGTTTTSIAPIMFGSVFPFSPSATALVSFLPIVRDQESDAAAANAQDEAEADESRAEQGAEAEVEDETGLRQRRSFSIEGEA